MEIINFSGTNFRDIPDQDNPSFHMGMPPCLMIVRSSKHFINGQGFTVLEIQDPDDDSGERVTSLGHFYKVSNAEIFADAFIAKININLENN